MMAFLRSLVNDERTIRTFLKLTMLLIGSEHASTLPWDFYNGIVGELHFLDGESGVASRDEGFFWSRGHF